MNIKTPESDLQFVGMYVQWLTFQRAMEVHQRTDRPPDIELLLWEKQYEAMEYLAHELKEHLDKYADASNFSRSVDITGA